MDRRVLIVFIAIMSALVVLLMVHFNQQAIAPTPEPTTLARDNGIVNPFTNMTNVTQKNTTSIENVTAVPTLGPAQPTISHPAPTHQPITKPAATPTPTPLPSGMTPWGPWGRMAAATPMAPVSWNDTLWNKVS